MKSAGNKSEDILMKHAEMVGIAPEKAKEVANSVEVNRQLVANSELGKGIGISGTPAFVIGEKLVPGAIEYDQLKMIIAEERAKSQKDAE